VPLVSACSFRPPAGTSDGGVEFDARELDAPPPVDALPLGPWKTPIRVNNINSVQLDDDPSLTADMLEMYFASNRGNASFVDEDLYVAKRDSLIDSFKPPTKIAELSQLNALDSNVEISGDGRTITFTSSRSGNDELWIADRPTRTDNWMNLRQLGELNSVGGEYGAVVTELASGELEVVFCTSRDGNEQLYRAQKAPSDTMYSPPVAIEGVVNTADHECDGARPDEATLYFTRGAVAAPTKLDIFRARWNGTSYTDLEPVPELNTTGKDSDPWLSPDQRTIYFSRDIANNGNDEIYSSTR